MAKTRTEAGGSGSFPKYARSSPANPTPGKKFNPESPRPKSMAELRIYLTPRDTSKPPTTKSVRPPGRSSNSGAQR